MIKNRPGNNSIFLEIFHLIFFNSNGINILTPKRKKKVPFTTLTKPSSSSQKSPDGKSEKSDQSEPVQNPDPIVID